MSEITMTLEDIEEKSPQYYDIEGQLIDPNGQYAYYGANCCWWTTYREDIGKSQHARAVCCPHCQCKVQGSGLERFIKKAKADPDHYGPRGLEALVLAHSRNVTSWCSKSWWRYTEQLSWLDDREGQAMKTVDELHEEDMGDWRYRFWYRAYGPYFWIRMMTIKFRSWRRRRQ